VRSHNIWRGRMCDPPPAHYPKVRLTGALPVCELFSGLWTVPSRRRTR